MKLLSKKFFGRTVIKYFLSYLIIFTVLISGFFFILRNQLADRYFDQLKEQAQSQLQNLTNQLTDDLLYLYQIDLSLFNNTNLIMPRYKTEGWYNYQALVELKKYDTTSMMIESIIYMPKGSDTILPIMSSPKSLIFRAFLLISYLKNKARSDEQSWYHVQNS